MMNMDKSHQTVKNQWVWQKNICTEFNKSGCMSGWFTIKINNNWIGDKECS